jgi:hypothetical protein
MVCSDAYEWHILLIKLFGGSSMGFILDMTETLKTPAGMVGLLVLGGIIYVWYKWMFAPHPDDED